MIERCEAFYITGHEGEECKDCKQVTELERIICELESSACSDPSWETNRKLKKDWAARLRNLWL